MPIERKPNESAELCPSRDGFCLTQDQFDAIHTPPIIDGIRPTDDQIAAWQILRILKSQDSTTPRLVLS